MSYNVRKFNQWKWINKDSIPTKIINFINTKNPDILLLQEYYNLEKFKFNYPYKFIKTKNKNKKLGLAVYSKYPILHKGSFDFKETSNNIIYTDIVKNKDTIRIYNLHLQSLQLNTDKENFGEEDSEKLIIRLKNRFKKQAEQVTLLLAHEKEWQGNKIIAGDFNNNAYSWVYREISKNKKDAFIEAGIGFGKTYNYFLPMRIDFILTDKNTSIKSFKTFDKKYSDHFPIQATLEIKK
jgi:endonuclease/exonuclease/phosphatase family metal-dependent hydrolase